MTTTPGHGLVWHAWSQCRRCFWRIILPSTSNGRGFKSHETHPESFFHSAAELFTDWCKPISHPSYSVLSRLALSLSATRIWYCRRVVCPQKFLADIFAWCCLFSYNSSYLYSFSHKEAPLLLGRVCNLWRAATISTRDSGPTFAWKADRIALSKWPEVYLHSSLAVELFLCFLFPREEPIGPF